MRSSCLHPPLLLSLNLRKSKKSVCGSCSKRTTRGEDLLRKRGAQQRGTVGTRAIGTSTVNQREEFEAHCTTSLCHTRSDFSCNGMTSLGFSHVAVCYQKMFPTRSRKNLPAVDIMSGFKLLPAWCRHNSTYSANDAQYEA